MLFKEKMFLANCDPVRRLSGEELEKRFLMSLALSQGAILTPNLLLDNAGMASMLDGPVFKAWAKSKKGRGNLVVRVVGHEAPASIEDYFDNLPGQHFLTRFQCRKEDLSRLELAQFRADLFSMDRSLKRLDPIYAPVPLNARSLSDAILASPALEQWKLAHPDRQEALGRLEEEAASLNSRSLWYRACEERLDDQAPDFKLEVIDACYNGLFVAKGEAFVMDRIPVLGHMPATVATLGVGAQALSEQRKWFDYAMKGFDLVTAFGAGQLVEFLTEEAASYVEDKLQDTSYKWATRKNWFGLYPKLTRTMGIEIR